MSLHTEMEQGPGANEWWSKTHSVLICTHYSLTDILITGDEPSFLFSDHVFRGCLLYSFCPVKELAGLSPRYTLFDFISVMAVTMMSGRQHGHDVAEVCIIQEAEYGH